MARAKPTLALVTTGVLLLLCYPIWGQAPLAWIALAPAMWVWKEAPRPGALAPGTALAGLAWSGGTFYPLLFVRDGTWAERLLGLAALCALIALFLFAFLSLYRLAHRIRPQRPAWRLVWVAPALWVGLEYLMRWGAVGFSVYMGVTQWESAWLRALSAYGGIHGVSALVVGVNALAVEAAAAWALAGRMAQVADGRIRGGAGRARWAVVFTGLVVAAALGVRGGLLPAATSATHGVTSGDPALSASPVSSETPGDSITVVLVQPHFTPERYENARGDAQAQSALLEEVLAQTRGALAQTGTPHAGSVLVVWPETTLHVRAFENPRLKAQLDAFMADAGAALVLGLPRSDLASGTPAAQDSTPKEYNSAFVVHAEGTPLGVYDKVHVIPIAEAQYAPGTSFPVFAPFARAGERGPLVGVGICSDAVEPRHALALVRQGASSLHYLSSLSHIGAIARIERAFLTFRAAEHGVWVTQTATTGPTLVVDPTGRIVDSVRPGAPGALVARIDAGAGSWTWYTRYGDWPVGLGAAALILHGIAGAYPRAGRGRIDRRRSHARRGVSSSASATSRVSPAPRGPLGPSAVLLVALLLVAPLVFSASAPAVAQSDAGGGANARGGDTLTAWLVERGESARRVVEGGRESVRSRFEKAFPGLTLDVRWLPWDELYVNLVRGAAAGELPDVFQFSREALAFWVELGVAADLSGRVSEWEEYPQFYPPARDAGVWNGGVYAVPVAARTYVMAYSTIPMVRTGWDPKALPGDWETFRAFVQKHTIVEQGVPRTRGTDPGWLGTPHAFLAALYQAGGSFFEAGGTPGFASGEGVEALTYLAELYDTVALPALPPAGAGVPEPAIAVGRHASALLSWRDWVRVRTLAPQWYPFMEAAAQPAGSVRAVPVEVDLLGVSATSVEPDAAWELVRLLAGAEVSGKLARSAQSLPVRRDAHAWPEWERDRGYLAFVESLERHGRPWPTGVNAGSALARVNLALQAVFSGQLSPREALDEAARLWRLTPAPGTATGSTLARIE